MGTLQQLEVLIFVSVYSSIYMHVRVTNTRIYKLIRLVKKRN